MVESVKKYNIFRQTWLPIFTCLRLKRYDTILSRKNIRYKKIDHQYKGYIVGKGIFV